MTDSSRTPTLAPAHDPLREDVGYLGNLLGEVIRREAGDDLFAVVEATRHAAIARRGADEPPGALARSLAGLPPDRAGGLVHAFSLYFSLTNLAEQVHRIRRRRDYRLEEVPQPGSLAAVFDTLADADPERVRAAVASLRIVPVFTAHPTEATRRTILKKEQRIARALVDRIERTRRTPDEERRLTDRIRTEIELMWGTAEQASMRPTVADEVEHVLFFLSEVVYRVIPPFHETLREAAASFAGDPRTPAVRFGSWVGGDMDGNPNVGADTVLATLERQRELVLERYRSEVRGLFEHLSQAEPPRGVDPGLDRRIRDYGERFPEADIPARYADMPYRVFLWQVWHRLGLVADDLPGGYPDPEALLDDLAALSRSLGPGSAGEALVERLALRVRTFGFHLATLDLRQDARVHRRVIGRLLEDPGFADRSPGERTAILENATAEDADAAPGDAETGRVLAVFRSIGEARRRFGPEAIGLFLISMAQGPDDALAVLHLARRAGLAGEDGNVPLDVAPLFETVDDLQRAGDTLDTLLRHPVYRSHLESRGNRQTVMLGYSDSAKISGVGASRWALYRAQEELLAVARDRGIDLDFFHGRGGTIARGGSKPRAAVLAGPPGATPGRLRLTEQGEIINGKYGLRGIAVRTLELNAGAALEAAVRDPDRPPVPEAWREAMETFARASREAWTALVRGDARFLPYFRSATPIDVIERMAMGSRPASRSGEGGLEDLRAIPWVFAWTQNRQVLPAWYGLGAGLAAAEAEHGAETLRRMAREWPFFANLLGDASMALAKADPEIASVYAELADEEIRTLNRDIRSAFVETEARVLSVLGGSVVLESEPLLREIIRLRNPYVDPMSLLQVDLLRRWREGNRRDEDLERALFATVRGIARGLRNTG